MGFKSINGDSIDFRTSAFLIMWHVIVLVGLPIYLSFRTPALGLILLTIVFLFVTGTSITAGYHRFYSHRAYSMNKVGEFFFLLFGTMAMQSSVVYWAHKHRLHHRFVDTEKDPHSIKQSFFHAHMGWLFKKQIPIDWSVIPDIKENKLTYFQHVHYHKLTFGLNILVFLLMGWLFNDYWGAFIIGWWTRVAVLSHSTYFINSLAHTWGEKTYSREQTAVNNAVIAFLTFGEGYHNYHHVFASDYRNGVRWYQYDPTKWLVWGLSKLGITSDLKKVDLYLSRKRIVQEDTHIFIDALKKSTSEKREILEQKVHELSATLVKRLTDMRMTIQEYRQLKKERNTQLKEKRLEIKTQHILAKKEWKSWLSLGREISRVAPMAHHFH